MKKIIALLAMVAVAPLAQAETDFSWNGESRARFEHKENTSFTDSAAQEDVKHRTKLGLTAKTGESWTGKVTLIHNYDFGTNSGDGNTSGITQDSNNTQNLLLVNEAFFNWMVNESWTVQVGRRGLHWADGSVLGRNDYEVTPTSWDGASAIWDHDMFTAEFTWNKTDEETTNSGVRASDPEGKVWGAGVNFKGLGDWLKTTHVHLLKQSDDEDSGNNLGIDVLRYGVTLGGGAMGIWYNLTYAGYSGDRFVSGASAIDMTGSMIDAKVGYGMDNWGAHVGYHTDSGDDSGTSFDRYVDLASDRHGRAGKMDVLAWGNLTSINVGGEYSFNDGKCKVALDYWIFTQTEKTDGSNGGTFNTGLTANNATEDALGSEIDVELTHAFDNGFEALARVGMFTPGDEFGTSDETAMQYFLQGRMPF